MGDEVLWIFYVHRFSHCAILRKQPSAAAHILYRVRCCPAKNCFRFLHIRPKCSQVSINKNQNQNAIKNTTIFSQKALVLVIYDISDDKKRRELVKYLQSYGGRVQKSAFECIMTKKLYKSLVKDMKKYVDPKTDSIRIYKLNRDNEILNFGINKLTDLKEIKIL